MAVGGLDAGRQCSSTSAGIRYEGICAPGAGKPHMREIVQVELALIEHPCAAHLLQAHAVSYHEDDVPDFICLGRFLNLHDIIGVRGLVILELRLSCFLAGDQQHGCCGYQNSSFHYGRLIILFSQGCQTHICTDMTESRSRRQSKRSCGNGPPQCLPRWT